MLAEAINTHTTLTNAARVATPAPKFSVLQHMSAACKLAAEYVCATVCDGKTFWLPGGLQTMQRKCTQGRVQVCRRRTVREGGDDDDATAATQRRSSADVTHTVLVRKILNARPAYTREKAALVRCNAASNTAPHSIITFSLSGRRAGAPRGGAARRGAGGGAREGAQQRAQGLLGREPARRGPAVPGEAV